MFSMQQKKDIAEAVQKILQDTKHPELPEGEISFSLSVKGAEDWSYAEIRNNGFFGATNKPSVNPHNEAMDPATVYTALQSWLNALRS